MSRFKHNFNVYEITAKPETDRLIKEYAYVFKDLGNVEGECHINLHQNAKPIIHPPRKVSLTILPRLKETHNKLIKANIISKINLRDGKLPGTIHSKLISNFLSTM